MAPARSPAGKPHADGREAVVAQGLQVAVGLRVDQRAERVGLAGHVERRPSESCTSWRKRPVGGPALVELAGGVQEARAVAERRRDAVALDHRRAQAARPPRRSRRRRAGSP